MSATLADTSVGTHPVADVPLLICAGVLLAGPSARGRELLDDYLADRGFAVWTADSGVQALDLYVRNQGEIELVVADAALHDLPGMAFVRRFRPHFPGVPLFVLADDPFGPLAGELTGLGVTVIPRPIHLRQFLDTLRAVLATTPLF